MKESFIFYASFLEAIEELDDKKQLKIYKAISNFALKNSEPEGLQGIEKAIFALIKPQILANNKRFEDGKKGGEFGKLGGRPKKQKTPVGFSEKTPNVNVNDNVNDNVNLNVNEEGFLKKEKKEDPFFENSIVKEFQKHYTEHFNCKAFLSAQQRVKLMELNSEIPDFKETIPTAIERLKNLKFSLPNFTPTANWLLKDDNYTAIMNGTFEQKKDEFDIYCEKASGDEQT